MSQRPSPTALKDDRYPWTAKRNTVRDDLRRRGASIILVLAMLTTFAILAAITIDYAYMGLVQTELRIATDAAAKAGAEALSRTEKINEARHAAVHYASLNSVAGEPFRIRDSDVSVGRLNCWRRQWRGSPCRRID